MRTKASMYYLPNTRNCGTPCDKRLGEARITEKVGVKKSKALLLHQYSIRPSIGSEAALTAKSSELEERE
jgi:hypothetical protein